MRANGLKKTYPQAGGRLTVLRDVSFCAAPGEISVVLGESGCGKTTLLRLAAGLEKPDGGEISGLEAGRTSFVFQEPRLLPWRNVLKNVTFGMKKANPDEAVALLRLMGLENFALSLPAALSGGMAQRVALARALAAEPEYLLMDEPFAALDPFTRGDMQRLARTVREERRVGMLFVTHSVEEALVLADTIFILADGVMKRAYALDGFPSPRDASAGRFTALKAEILHDLERKKVS